jgi:hypothetical protein
MVGLTVAVQNMLFWPLEGVMTDVLDPALEKTRHVSRSTWIEHLPRFSHSNVDRRCVSHDPPTPYVMMG